jgi:hypothetical protein
MKLQKISVCFIPFSLSLNVFLTNLKVTRSMSLLNATLANIQQNLVAALLSSDDALRFASREFDLQVNY